jgi:hypothetical protein
MRNRVTQYYDRERREVRTGSVIIRRDGVQPKKHPERYVYLGSYYAHERWPYVAGGVVMRTSYGKANEIYDPETRMKTDYYYGNKLGTYQI